jgi:Arsenical resistance operon protein ArsD
MPAAVHVFDPPMCCASGACGPAVDPALARFAADLDWLKTQGAAVERYNLSQQPAAFAARPEVTEAMTLTGTDCLPLVLVDGRVVSRGGYPTRAELAAWAGVAPATSAPLDQGGCGGGSSSCC